MYMKFKKFYVSTLFLFFGFQNLFAVSPPTSTFNVTITIEDSCLTATSTNISFGTRGVITSAIQQTGTLSITCTKGTLYSIALTPSNGNLLGNGEMAGTGGNTDTVQYNLSQDAANSIPWGATNGSNELTGTGTGSVDTKTVYANISNTGYTPDTYTDTVTITVTY